MTEEVNRNYVIKVSNIRHKIWLTGELQLLIRSERDQNMFSTLMQKVYYSQLKVLRLDDFNLTYSEYLKLTSSKSVTNFNFCEVTVKNNETESVPLEVLMEQLPNVEKLRL